MATQKQVPSDPRLDVEFDRAFELLRQIVDFDQVDQMHPVRSNAVYTTSLVLWMLVYQRMSSDSTLEAAVKKMIQAKPVFLPKNKRVEEGTLSTGTGAYSQARGRMPLEAAKWLAQSVSQSLIEASPPTHRGRRVYLIDGTTITLAPEEELQTQFPPASNQFGEGVWPVAQLVVAHELASGAALIPEVGPMYGDNAVSETVLVHRVFAGLPSESLALADAAFGIFRVAYEARQTGHPFLLRMTKARFLSLRKQATPIAQGPTWKTFAHTWRPSAQERKKHPDLPPDAMLEVHLHEIVVNEELTLYLVTDLRDEDETATALAAVYKQRVDVEIDIRNMKVVLDTETIRARSVVMFEKELLMSVVSYNLVIQFRRQAAELAKVPPRRMSFKRTWTTFCTFLLSAMYADPESWRAQYRLALHYATKDKLPNRPGRSDEREAYSRRPKSAQFKRRKPKRNMENVN